VAAKLGILAGGGTLPRLVADAAAATGRDVHILAFDGFCEASTLAGFAHTHVPLAKVGRLFQVLRETGCRDVVLAGPVRRPTLAQLRPDWTGFWIALKLLPVWGGDASLLSRVLALIEAQGFRAVGAHEIVPDLLAEERVYGACMPDAAAWADIAQGLAAARALGARERGQAVLVRDGQIVGTETRGGTAALLRQSGIAGAVLAKAAMPGQDRRVDLPTAGAATVAAAAQAGLRGIALEAGNALLLERDEAVAAADRAKIFVAGACAKN
jgi:UDP-2,3-diacylglucosamine hydrolase